MTYPGGKGNAYHTIINRIPPHDVYIEAFFGGGSVMQYKRPAQRNIGIDIDPATETVFDDITCQTPWDAEWEFYTADAIAMLAYWLAENRISPNRFIYLDPPYLRSTRRDPDRDLYRFEMTREQHIELLNLVRQLPCYVMISGYRSDLYDQALTGCGWHTHQFQQITRGGSMATEWLWMNYPPPDRLHDYRYLGENFRERERIKRKKERWVRRLKEMPRLERQAILSAIEEFAEASPGVASRPPAQSPNTARAAPIAGSGDAR